MEGNSVEGAFCSDLYETSSWSGAVTMKSWAKYVGSGEDGEDGEGSDKKEDGDEPKNESQS